MQTEVSSDDAKTCSFAPISAIALGPYDWQKGISTTVGAELSVQCNLGVVYSFASDRGLNSVAAQNFLASGSSRLAYTLLVKDAGAAPFDPAANDGASAETEIATGNVDPYALVLNVPAAQMVPAGTYTDTVTFSLNY